MENALRHRAPGNSRAAADPLKKTDTGASTVELRFENLLTHPKEYAVVIASVLVAALFCIPDFRALLIAGPVKLLPVSLLAFFVHMRKRMLPLLAQELTLVSAGLVFHSLGDSFLHQHPSSLFQATILFGVGWLWFTAVLLLTLRRAGIAWTSVSLATKAGFVAAGGYAFAVVGFLLWKFDVGKDSYWALTLIPYAIIETCTLCAALASRQKWLTLGILLYVVSDSMIAVEDVLRVDLSLATWPLYYTAQCLICVGFLSIMHAHQRQSRSHPLFSVFGGTPLDAAAPVH